MLHHSVFPHLTFWKAVAEEYDLKMQHLTRVDSRAVRNHRPVTADDEF